MNCPYCQKQLEKGYMISSGRLLWSDEQCKSGWIKGGEDIKLAGRFDDNPPALLCRDCRKIILDY